jgi:hypothetical protein
MMIPGVQKPHCDPPVGEEGLGETVTHGRSRPSIVVTDRPATRATA